MKNTVYSGNVTYH